MKVVNPMFVNEIVSNHNIKEMHNLDDVQLSASNQFTNVTDEAIPVDASVFREMHTVSVKSGVQIQSHAHKYPVFRYITDGSMNLNGIEYGKGDWMVVPSGTNYQIQTGPEGYMALCGCIVWNENNH